MKKTLTTIILILTTTAIFAQLNGYTVEFNKYTYDATGNRIKREFQSIYYPPFKPPGGLSSSTTKSSENTTLITAKETILDKIITVYPNPTKGNLQLQIENYNNEPITAVFYTNNGKQIKAQNINSSISELDITKQPKGIYYLQIIINNESREFKVVKE